MAPELLSKITIISCGATAVFLLIWTSISIFKTLIPYGKSARNESVMICRLVIRLVLASYLIESAAFACLRPTANHTAAMVWDSILAITTFIAAIACMKNHPDGVKGL